LAKTPVLVDNQVAHTRKNIDQDRYQDMTHNRYQDKFIYINGFSIFNFQEKNFLKNLNKKKNTLNKNRLL